MLKCCIFLGGFLALNWFLLLVLDLSLIVGCVLLHITGEHPAAMQHNSGFYAHSSCCMLIVLLFTCCLQRLIINLQLSTTTTTITKANSKYNNNNNNRNKSKKNSIYNIIRNRTNNNVKTHMNSVPGCSQWPERNRFLKLLNNSDRTVIEAPEWQSLTVTRTTFVARIEVKADISQSSLTGMQDTRSPDTIAGGSEAETEAEAEAEAWLVRLVLAAADAIVDATMLSYEPQWQILRRNKKAAATWSSEARARLMAAAEHYSQHKLNLYGRKRPFPHLLCPR